MDEIRTSSIISPDQVLLRNIKSILDENIFTMGDFTTGFYTETLSSGTPIEVLESIGKLFASIADAYGFAENIQVYRWLDQENAQLRTENYVLKERIRAIEERLVYIESVIPKEKKIILREISKEKAKEEIRKLFSTGRTLYYSDIAKELGLDLEIVVGICNELQESGEINIDARVS